MAPKTDPTVAALQTAITSANGYHGAAVRRCNEAHVIATTLAASASHDGIEETRQAIQKVQKAAEEAEEVFRPVIVRLRDDNELAKFKERTTTITDTSVTAVAMCLWAIGAAEAALLAVRPTPAAAAATAAPGAPGRLVEALKPGVLTLDASPMELRQWKRKLVTYLRRSGVPAWGDMMD